MKLAPKDVESSLPSTEFDSGSRLTYLIDQSVAMLKRAIEVGGLDHWIVMFSGGKDSTVALALALRAAEETGKVKRIDVILGDTKVEIPLLKDHATSFLAGLPALEERSRTTLKTHVTTPSDDRSFWVYIIGRGYPPPHRSFRWCTTKLKIEPAEKIIRREMTHGRTAILTGVRFGESDARDRRLNLSCSRGGECGHGMWVQSSPRLGAVYLGPIIAWKECDIWDFLNYVAPSWGYSTESLNEIYKGPQTRFGCWTCTVVKQDRAMAKLTQREEYSTYAELRDLRDWLQVFGKEKENRVLRENGVVGRLTLAARAEILKRVLEAQERSGHNLIEASEVALIREIWADPARGDSYLTAR